MVRLADIDVNAEADKLIPKALELAKELGHAAAIMRRGAEFFVWDSWLEAQKAQAMRLVGTNGSVVRL